MQLGQTTVNAVDSPDEPSSVVDLSWAVFKRSSNIEPKAETQGPKLTSDPLLEELLDDEDEPFDLDKRARTAIRTPITAIPMNATAAVRRRALPTS